MEIIGEGNWEDLSEKINSNFDSLGEAWQLSNILDGIKRIPSFFRRINPLNPGSPGGMLKRFIISSGPDTHGIFTQLTRLDKFTKLINFDGIIKAHIIQGDILLDKQTKVETLSLASDFETACDVYSIDVLAGLGNHDQNAEYSNLVNVVLSKAEQRQHIIDAALDNVSNVVFGTANNACYYYKDYIETDSYKVRVIHLDLYDMPQDVDGDSYKYTMNEGRNYSNAQLNWLANVALNLPDSNYHVIMFGHQTMGASAIYNTSGTAILNIIDAFATQGTVVMSDATTDFEYSINYDFSVINGFNGNFAGYFYGHGHVLLVGQTEINGNLYNNIELPASAPYQTSIGYWRQPETGGLDMATFIILDTEDRRIFLLRYGNPCDVDGVGLPYGDFGIETEITY